MRRRPLGRPLQAGKLGAQTQRSGWETPAQERFTRSPGRPSKETGEEGAAVRAGPRARRPPSRRPGSPHTLPRPPGLRLASVMRVPQRVPLNPPQQQRQQRQDQGHGGLWRGEEGVNQRRRPEGNAGEERAAGLGAAIRGGGPPGTAGQAPGLKPRALAGLCAQRLPGFGSCSPAGRASGMLEPLGSNLPSTAAAAASAGLASGLLLACRSTCVAEGVSTAGILLNAQDQG